MPKKKKKIFHTERIPLAVIYKQDGNINIEFGEDHRPYEIYGYLSCLVRDLEEQCQDNLFRE